MAVDKETRILKSNTIEQLRQKTNEVSLNLGDTDLLDSLVGDKVFDYSNVAVGTNLVQGSDDNSLVQKFNLKPDETLDNTGGYIILKNSPSIPSGFVDGAVVSQSGGFSATIVVAKPEKILVRNTSGTFSASENLTVGSDNIAHANILRLITESYKVGNLRVFKNGTELTQNLLANGFHVPQLSGVIALTGSPALAGYEEGTIISQSGGFSATVLKATSTALFLKTHTGTYQTGQNITGGDAAIVSAKHTGLTTKDIAFGNAIELNTPTTVNTDDIQVKATSLVDALNEVQQDVGNIASLGTTNKTDIVSAINELETAAKGTQANYSVTAGSDFKSAINTLDAEIGTVADLNNAAGYTQQVLVPAITEIQGKIGEVTASNLGTSASTLVTAIKEHEDQIGDVNINSISGSNNTITGALTQLHGEIGTLSLNTPNTTDLTQAINSIDAVFDADQKKIISTPDFTLDVEGDIILDANGQDIQFKDGGTHFGSIRKDGDNLQLLSNLTDGDLVFRGLKSGPIGVTALTLDMSDDGTAIFNHDIKLPDSGQAIFGAGSDLKIYHDASDSYLDEVGTGLLYVRSDGLGIKLQVASSGTYYDAIQATAFGTTLLNQGAAKLSTDAQGINVTGQIDVSTDANITGDATIGGALDVGTLSTQFSVSNRNNVKLALNELHSELGNAVITGTNTAAAGLSNLTAAINAIDAEIGVTNTILNSVGNHSSTTVAGVLGNLSTAITSNDSDISTLNTFKTNIEAREIATGDGLTGGGNLSATRTLSVDLASTAPGLEIPSSGSDSGKLKVDSTVLRTNANKNIGSGTTITFDSGSSLIVNGTLTIAGSASGVSTFGVNFVEVDGSGNQQGLQVQNSFSGYSVDPRVQWNHTQIAANKPTRAWQLVGLAADGSTADTTDIVTFTNFGDLLPGIVTGNVETGITVTADAVNDNLDFAVQVDDSSIEIHSDNNLRVKASGITNSMLAASAVTNAKIANGTIASGKLAADSVITVKIADGAVTNTKLANSSLTIGDSTIALGGTDTTLTGLTDIDLTSGNKTIFDGVGANDLTIGASTTHVKIPGNFTVEGTTTTLNTATLDVTDLNITVGKNATSSSAANGAGLTFGNYSGNATFTYSHTGTKLVSNKDVQATRFLGPLTGNVTGNADTATTAGHLTSAKSFALSGDVTGTVNDDLADGVVIPVQISNNTVGFDELNAGTANTGDFLRKSGSGIEFAAIPAGVTYDLLVAQTGGNNDNPAIRLDPSSGTNDDIILTGGTGVTVTRTSATGITITNSSPDQTVALTGGSNVTITGTYPNFTIASTDTNTDTVDMGDGFVIEDGDGTEVVITENKEIKFVEGGGIDINWTDISTGSDADPYDLTFTIPAGGVTNAMLAGSITNAKLAGSIANNKLANSSITINGSAIALGGSVNTPNTMGSGFVLEDGDGTEVTITENKEIKFVEGGGININFTDTSTGSDGDPFDLTFTIPTDGVTNAMLADDSVGTAQLLATAVGTAELADTAVTTAKINNGAVTNAKLAGSITNAKLSNSTVSYGGVQLSLGGSDATPAFNLSDATNIPAGQLTGTINTARLPTNNVTNASVSGSTLTLTRQGASDVTHGPFDNYGSWSISDGSSSSTITSGNTVQINGTSGEITTTRSGDNITIALGHNYVGGIEHKNSGGASQGTGDIGSKGGRLVFKEGTNMSFSLSGTELTINGPVINNASNLTTGTIPDARLPSTIDTVLQIGNSNDTSIQFDQDTKIDFDVDNTLNARLTDVGDFLVRGDVVAVSSVIASDERLKEDIHRVEGALELVSQLDGVAFKWKEDGRQSAGVIAQNVEKVLPSAVHEVDNFDNSDKHKVVDYNQLSALLIEAIKELKEQNKELKNEIEVLKNINSNS